MTDKNEHGEPLIHTSDILYSGDLDYSYGVSANNICTCIAKLCIKSRIAHDHEDNDILRQLIIECYGDDDRSNVVTELINYEELGMQLYEHTVSFYDGEQYKSFLKQIYEHLVFPIGPYENLKYGDFEVEFVSGYPECHSIYMSKKVEMMEEQMMVDKHVMESLNNSIKKLETSVESITTFFNNMGLARYKPTIQAILEIMDNNGMVDKEYMESQIFTETH